MTSAPSVLMNVNVGRHRHVDIGNDLDLRVIDLQDRLAGNVASSNSVGTWNCLLILATPFHAMARCSFFCVSVNRPDTAISGLLIRSRTVSQIRMTRRVC